MYLFCLRRISSSTFLFSSTTFCIFIWMSVYQASQSAFWISVSGSFMSLSVLPATNLKIEFYVRKMAVSFVGNDLRSWGILSSFFSPSLPMPKPFKFLPLAPLPLPAAPPAIFLPPWALSFFKETKIPIQKKVRRKMGDLQLLLLDNSLSASS